MPTPLRPKLPTDLPDLEWLITDDGSRTLWDSTLKETYHSGCGAVAESLIVYLKNSGVLQRLLEGQSTHIFEMGFGTGTAFLLTAALAEKLAIHVDYWAIDLRPLPARLVSQLDLLNNLSRVIDDNFQSKVEPRDDAPPRIAQKAASTVAVSDFELLPQMTAKLAQQLDCLQLCSSSFCSTKSSSIAHIALGEFVRLHLIIGDLTTLDIERDYPELAGRCDAVYFDAFSPETDAELWTSAVMTKMRRILEAHGVLTSYCVKSSVRKTLESVGFSIMRLPGPIGGKREVLKALAKGSK